MKYFILSGEASGDIYGAQLIRELQAKDPTASFLAWGGEKIQATGVRLSKHIDELAFMGFAEVVANARTINRNFKQCKEQMLEFDPDAIIFIDYPGFNLRMAAWAQKLRAKKYYYVSPQVWAWKKSRVAKLKKYIDKLFVILPFEKDFFAKQGFEVEFPGHPLIEEIEQFKNANPANHQEQKIIALLPGSRKQEISRMLPVMVELSQLIPEYRFIVAESSHVPESFYKAFYKPSTLSTREGSYSLLQKSKAAIVSSGTATLETALFKVPQVVVYKLHPISYWMAKRLIKVPYISLVNLILDKPVVRELIQGDCNASLIKSHLDELLLNPESQIADYKQLAQVLKNNNASSNVANYILKDLTSNFIKHK